MSDPIPSNSTNSSKIGDLSNVKSSKIDSAKVKKALVITGLVLAVLAGVAMAATGGAFMSLGIVGAAVVPLLSIGVTIIAVGLVASAVTLIKSRKKATNERVSQQPASYKDRSLYHSDKTPSRSPSPDDNSTSGGRNAHLYSLPLPPPREDKKSSRHIRPPASPPPSPPQSKKAGPPQAPGFQPPQRPLFKPSIPIKNSAHTSPGQAPQRPSKPIDDHIRQLNEKFGSAGPPRPSFPHSRLLSRPAIPSQSYESNDTLPEVQRPGAAHIQQLNEKLGIVKPPRPQPPKISSSRPKIPQDYDSSSAKRQLSPRDIRPSDESIKQLKSKIAETTKSSLLQSMKSKFGKEKGNKGNTKPVIFHTNRNDNDVAAPFLPPLHSAPINQSPSLPSPSRASPLAADTVDPNSLDTDEVKSALQNVSSLLPSTQSTADFQRIESQGHNLLSFTLKSFPGIVFSTVNHGPQSPISSRDAATVQKDLMQLSDMVRAKKAITEGLNLKAYPNLRGASPKFFRINVEGKGVGFIAEAYSPQVSFDESSMLWEEKEIELTPSFVDLAKLNSNTGFAQIDPGHFRPCLVGNKWSLYPTDGVRARDTMNSSLPLENMIGNLHLRSTMEQVIDAAKPEWRPVLTTKMNQRLQDLGRQ